MDTVQQVHIGVLALPVGRDRHRILAGLEEGDALAAEVDRGGGVDLRVDTGAQRRQLQELASVQRKFGDLLGSDDMPEGGVVGLQRDGIRGDLHRLGHLPYRHRDVHARYLIHLQHDAGHGRSLHAGRFHFDGIGGWLQEDERVVAAGAGRRVALEAGLGIRQSDGRTRDDRAGRVLYGAGDGPGRSLSVQAGSRNERRHDASCEEGNQSP